MSQHATTRLGGGGEEGGLKDVHDAARAQSQDQVGTAAGASHPLPAGTPSIAIVAEKKTAAEPTRPDAQTPRPSSVPPVDEAPGDAKPTGLQDKLHPEPVAPRGLFPNEQVRSPTSPNSMNGKSAKSPRFAPQDPRSSTRASGRDTYPPGHSPRTPGHHTGQPPTPILALGQAALPDQPEFAELLTPAQLRRRRRPRAALSPDAPEAVGAFAGRPLLAGPSRLGWTTPDGDLYRGAHSDPLASSTPMDKGNHDDAITIASASSGSSSWSWGSGALPAAAEAVVRRLGAIGRRRGSSSSSDSLSTLSSTSSSSDGPASRIAGRLGRVLTLTRTMSRATNDSTEDRPRRVHVPRRREFILVLPPEVSSTGTTPIIHGSETPVEGVTPSSTPNRVITTPVLAPILEAIRAERSKMGILNPKADPTVPRKVGRSDIPLRRGGSAPGRSRQQRTFTAPPVPIPTGPLRSRVEVLRGAGGPIRPKSASDLLGMVSPRSTSDVNLTSLAEHDYGIPTEPPSLTLSPTPTLSDVTVTAPPKPPPAWWLDVSCPTWKDLKDIGELLGLHPLTLEDVLHQDPREKLDTYDTLGYYFIVVRALDEQYFKYTPGSAAGAPPGAALADVGGHGTHAPSGVKKERTRRGWGFGRATGRVASKTGEKVEIVEDNPGKEGLEGVGVGGVNLYLVVFVDGIVSFHYDDVSKHTMRVRKRLLEQRHEPTSDWIAHGLLDSIVDAFFPLTGYVDGAVDDMDSLTIDPTRDPRKEEVICKIDESPTDEPFPAADVADGEWIELETIHRPPKPKPKDTVLRRTLQRALKPHSLNANNAHTPFRLALLYLKLFFFPITSARPKRHDAVLPDVYDRSTMLRSITNMRRLVTGLTRLLGGKNMVVASLLKRAADNARLGHASSDHEAYLSDVHDHILLLQTSLYHYEYILAHCQPAYLSYLSVSSSFAKGGTDKLILALSTVSIGILPMQVVIGMFSMNVNLPHNGGHDDPPLRPDGSHFPYNWFIAIVIIIFFVACGLLCVIRYWRWAARKKWTALRGGDIPSTWNGYWGWE